MRRRRQLCFLQQSRQAGAEAITHESANTLRRHAAQFRQAFFEQGTIAGQQRPQHEAGGELATAAKMMDQRAKLRLGAFGGDGYGRLVAGFARNAAGAIRLKPGPADNKFGDRLRHLGHQVLPDRGRKILARE